jgi:Fe-S-cluster containining protein
MQRAAEIDGILADLDRLHAEIDRVASRLSALHVSRLQCARGCSACCIDDLTVSAIEAERICSGHAALLERGKPHPPGACAFLDAEGACRIYANRPSVCRSQGLPLRMLFEDEQGEIEERRDICVLNLPGGPALDQLDEEQCWLIGPFESKLLELESRAFGDRAPRVALRSLFRSSSDEPAAGADSNPRPSEAR